MLKYMLLHISTYLDLIPLTSSGKANRNALPDVEHNQITSSKEYFPPTNKNTENSLLAYRGRFTNMSIVKRHLFLLTIHQSLEQSLKTNRSN